MKKTIYLFSVLMLCFIASFSVAQSLQVLDLNGNDVSSTVINISGDSAYSTIMTAPFDVKNVSGTTVNVKAKKIENSMQPGSTSNICFAGQCYLSSVYVSPNAASIAAGAKDTTFQGDYRPKGNLGISIITYVFFRTDNPNDSAIVIVQFNAIAAGLENFNDKGFEVSAPYPNPSSSFTSFDYYFPEKSNVIFSLSDITGNIIKEIPVYNTKGTLELPTNDLSEGMYFYSFYVDGKRQMTKKLIIKK